MDPYNGLLYSLHKLGSLSSPILQQITRVNCSHEPRITEAGAGVVKKWDSFPARKGYLETAHRHDTANQPHNK